MEKLDKPLQNVARRVNWYTEPDITLANADLSLCQVMARGGIDDILTVRQLFSWETFRVAYLHAPPGLFTQRAWANWGLMPLDDPRHPMRERFPGANRFDWRSATS